MGKKQQLPPKNHPKPMEIQTKEPPWLLVWVAKAFPAVRTTKGPGKVRGGERKSQAQEQPLGMWGLGKSQGLRGDGDAGEDL